MNPIKREEIRWIIWREVFRLLKIIEKRHNFMLKIGAGIHFSSFNGLAIPEVETWMLVEALSLAVIISSAKKVTNRTRISGLFGNNGPIEFFQNAEARYLWAQPLIQGRDSGLGGRPDLVVTRSSKPPSSENILEIIECKAEKKLGTTVIRQEFGKAYDLDTGSYLIWSLWTPKDRIVLGARRLGLDVYSFELDTKRAEEFAKAPGLLEEYTRAKIEESRRERRFVKIINESAAQHEKKWLNP